MCVCSVLAPHGGPEPPAPATRLSHHQSQAHDHSRRDARAAVHLSLKSTPIAQAPAPSSGTMPHRSATRPAGRFTARRARQHAARAGHRARAPLPEQGCCAESACSLHSSPACSEHSARVLRAAPLPPRAWSALHEARAWHAARTLRHPFSPLSSLPAHSTEHTLPACLHTQQSTQHTAPCARIRLTTQPAPHNNSLPHASPRRLALTPPAARSEKLQRAPLRPAVTSFLSLCILRPFHSPRRRASPGTHRSSEDVSRSMGYRPSCILKKIRK